MKINCIGVLYTVIQEVHGRIRQQSFFSPFFVCGGVGRGDGVTFLHYDIFYDSKSFHTFHVLIAVSRNDHDLSLKLVIGQVKDISFKR